MLRPLDDCVLQGIAQIAKIITVSGDAYDEIAIVVRFGFGSAQGVRIDDVEPNVVAVKTEMRANERRQKNQALFRGRQLRRRQCARIEEYYRTGGDHGKKQRGCFGLFLTAESDANRAAAGRRQTAGNRERIYPRPHATGGQQQKRGGAATGRCPQDAARKAAKIPDCLLRRAGIRNVMRCGVIKMSDYSPPPIWCSGREILASLPRYRRNVRAAVAARVRVLFAHRRNWDRRKYCSTR